MKNKKPELTEAKAKVNVEAEVSKPTKLNPCPFCGNRRLKFIHDGVSFWKGVECNKCKNNIYFFNKHGVNVGCGLNRKEAQIKIAEMWNRRTKDC